MIEIPTRLNAILVKNKNLQSAVQQNLNNFEPWLEQSGMPFFPGFTDHSPRHINDVLRTASSLISDDSYDLLTPEDVATLTLAILLHDCGMHLTQDSFRALVLEEHEGSVINGLEDKPWSIIWKDFLSEASRFGQEKLLAIFGDTKPLDIHAFNIDDLSEKDCLLVGEFVRRFHARLAHEIAITGVPSRNESKLEITGVDNDIKDLAGLVARSHGMSIRSTFKYIEERYNTVSEYRGIKTPFLMAILRISDYVQVQSERAIRSLLSVKELRSPVSKQEWKAHFAVRDVTTNYLDPEAIYVNANPKDVNVFLKLEFLFKDIQKELDHSWATLGEIYGRLPPLSKLGMTLRRIRSNLDNKKAFARTVQYIPMKAGFDTSGPDLLKLLVGPLYDYKSSVGIRELVQNAVDACRELEDIQKTDNKQKTEHDVIVSIQESEDGTGWITITDYGIGMTLETVNNYFLKAGASFRNSDLWKKQHTDTDGNSRVLRGGRFGVGALAAFLLGSEIEVKTRHALSNAAEGLEFKAKIDDPTVEILRSPKEEHGTTIRIWIDNPQTMREIKPVIYNNINAKDQPILLEHWDHVDWFSQSSPKIIYLWEGFTESPPKRVKAQFFATKNLVPEDKLLAEENDWTTLPDPAPYQRILWKYHNEYRYNQFTKKPESEICTVNGIKVLDSSKAQYGQKTRINTETRPSKDSFTYYINRPSIAIFDPLGVCPINLQRSAISFERMGIDETLKASILEKHIVEVKEFTKPLNSILSTLKVERFLRHREDIHYPNICCPLAISNNGYTIATKENLEKLKVKSIFVARVNEQILDIDFRKILQDGEYLLFFSDTSKSYLLSIFRGVFSSTYHHITDTGLPKFKVTSACAIIDKKTSQDILKKGTIASSILKDIKTKELSDHTLFSQNSTTSNSSDEILKRTAQIHTLLGKGITILSWAISAHPKKEPNPQEITNLWNEK
jgi:molecular chaperone HtpG